MRAKQELGEASMEEQMVLSLPGQTEVAISSGYLADAVCSATARSEGSLGNCSSGCLSSEISGSDVPESSGMTAVDCALLDSLCKETETQKSSSWTRKFRML